MWITTNCGQFLKRWEYQIILPASWEICMQVKKQVRIGHGTTDWSQIRKEYVKAVYCHPAYLTYMQSTSWEILGWMKNKLVEKEIAPHSSILAWKIPWTEEAGRLPSMGSQRVRHDWATSHSLSIRVDLISHIVFVLGLQELDWFIHRHMDFLFWGLFPYRFCQCVL